MFTKFEICLHDVKDQINVNGASVSGKDVAFQAQIQTNRAKLLPCSVHSKVVSNRSK